MFITRKDIRALLHSDEVKRNLRGRGERVLDAAVASVPRSTGRLAAAHRLEEDVVKDRARVRVVVTTEYAAQVAVDTGYLGAALSAGGGNV